MKAVKIVLAIAVVVIIGFFSWKWCVPDDVPPPTKTPTNQYTNEIQRKIDALGKMPKNTFCKENYQNIQSSIEEFYKNESLGLTSYKDGTIYKEKKDANINNQWKDILSKNLYSVYAPKFVEQAMYVFSRSEWKNDDLTFIRSEVKILKSSTFLGNTGLVSSFNDINTILAKYDAINSFINACKGYAYSNSKYDLKNTYPDVSEKIQKSRAYITNNLDNSYVNNCARLKEGLQVIPKILFDKHISYLKKTIDNNGDRYRYGEFNKQSDYSNSIYIPLKNQVDALNNDIYGIGNDVYENGYDSVYNLLSKYNRDATNYYRRL